MSKATKGFEERPAEFAGKPQRGQTLKIRQIGNSLGIVLPKETLGRLRASEGDELFVVETPGGIELRTYDPEVERQLEVARKIARRYRSTLRELAK